MQGVWMKTLLLVVLATLSTTVGEVLLAKGMKEVGDVSQLQWTELWKMLAMFANPKVVLGVVCMALFFFSYAASLSWADLSLVLPTTALSIAFATVIAWLWLGEYVSPVRWIGVMVIMSGILLIWAEQVSEVTKVPPVIQEAPLHPVPGE
jgi:drug/metabolite transporter (DMT)-like permease